MLPETDPSLIEILLVEDSPSDAHLAMQALSEGDAPNRVHLVHDGVDAIAFLRREGDYSKVPRPDMILLDLNLPKMDGHEVLHEIRRDDRFKDIPAVVLSASSDPADAEEAYGRGASYYMTKPADLGNFRRTIQSIQSAVTALKGLGINIDRHLNEYLCHALGCGGLEVDPPGGDDG